MIRTVYLAGGINGLSDADAKGWREEAKSLLPTSIQVLDPMRRDYRGRELENSALIVDNDLTDINLSDAVVAYCAAPSWGTAMEVFYAHNNSVKVVAIVPGDGPVSPWLVHHSDAVVTTVEDAVTQIEEWL